MTDKELEEQRQWYLGKRPIFEGLSDIVRSTVESLLKHSRVDHLSVSCRTKTLDGYLEKIHRKEYKDPQNQCTDLSGVRIITYIESDVAKSCDLIRDSFHVYPELSFDRSEELGVDRFGYRSVHFVCDLGSDRAKLPEFALYSDLKFEIQVRTVLQHAWAEIEHDRNYKFAGILPTLLQRRLYSLAGLLEIVDREFVALAQEVDNYADDVAEKTKAGDLDVEINTTSLMQFLPNLILSFDVLSVRAPLGPSEIEGATKELQEFGIRSLSDLQGLFDEGFLSATMKHDPDTTITGLLRSAMMYSDLKRYFQLAWQEHWQALNPETFDLLRDKYGDEETRAILANKVDIFDPGTGRFKKITKRRKKPSRDST